MSGEDELMSYLDKLLPDGLAFCTEGSLVPGQVCSVEDGQPTALDTDIAPASSNRGCFIGDQEAIGSNPMPPQTSTQLDLALHLLDSTKHTSPSVSHDDRNAIIADLCGNPEVTAQVIDSLHRDVENICSLIGQLRAIMNNKQKVKSAQQDVMNGGEPSVGTQAGQPSTSIQGELVNNLLTNNQPTTQMFDLINSPPETQLTTDTHPLMDNPLTVQPTNHSCESSYLTDTDKGVPEAWQPNESEATARHGERNPPQDHQPKVSTVRDIFYHCDSCSFKTTHLKNLNGHLITRHKKTVPGVKTYDCRFCEYRCVDKQRMDEHEPTHTGIKAFICGKCEKQFGTKRGLRTHLRFHNTERPYKCGQCDSSFKVRSKLNDHTKLIHTNKGEKPYQCGYCQHTASVRGNVNQHIRRVHRGKPTLVTIRKSVTAPRQSGEMT